MTIPELIPRRFTPAEYLTLERQAADRHEYIDGYIHLMPGASANHSRLNVALACTIGNQTQKTPCECFGSDMRVCVDANAYTYPDLSIVCGVVEVDDPEHDDNLLNPTAIFEVLSPSSEARDRGEKWGHYRRMPSLQQYVLVSQDKPLVEVFTRQGDVWTYTDASGLDASIQIESIGCALALGELYARISFEEVPPLGGGTEIGG